MIQCISLSGSWQVQQDDKNELIPAQVPSCVHSDLLAARLIPDPFYRDNENSLQWIGQTGWTYKRKFEISSAFLKNKQLLLKCAGLDTLANIRINGKSIGENRQYVPHLGI